MKKDKLIEEYKRMAQDSEVPTMADQIRAHLKAEAERSPLFAEKLDFEKFNDCMQYINDCAPSASAKKALEQWKEQFFGKVA